MGDNFALCLLDMYIFSQRVYKPVIWSWLCTCRLVLIFFWPLVAKNQLKAVNAIGWRCGKTKQVLRLKKQLKSRSKPGARGDRNIQADSEEEDYFLQENKGCLLLPGSFLLAHSRLSPRSGYVSRLIGPTLPGNMKYCLRFYFSLRGEWHPETLRIEGYLT